MKSNYIAESVLVACSLLIVVLVGAGAINLKESQREFFQEVKSSNTNISDTKTVLSQAKKSCEENKRGIIVFCDKIKRDSVTIDRFITGEVTSVAVIREVAKQNLPTIIYWGFTPTYNGFIRLFGEVNPIFSKLWNFLKSYPYLTQDQQLKKEIENG